MISYKNEQGNQYEQVKYNLSEREASWVLNQINYLYLQKKEALLLNPNSAEVIIDIWISNNLDMIKKALGTGFIRRKVDSDKLDTIKKAWLTTVRKESKKNRISFGDPTNNMENKAESPNTKETCVLPYKDLTYLSQILNKQTSGGAACVPTSHAYLTIIKNHITNKTEQEEIMTNIISKWKTKDNSKWVRPQKYYDHNDLKEIRVTSIKNPLKITGMLNLDRLLDFLSINEDETLIDNFDNYHSARDKKFRAVIFTTPFFLPSKVLHVSEENPYWDNDGVTKPEVGSSYTTASSHAMLAVDYKITNNGYELIVIDPQSGSILSINVNEMVAIAKKDPSYNIPVRRDTIYGLGTGVL